MTQTQSNKVSRLVFSGLKEIIGLKELSHLVGSGMNSKGEVKAALVKPDWESLPDQDLGRLQTVMEQKFGQKELQGLLVRSGRASCKFFVKEYGPDMQVTSIEYRLLPSKKRLTAGLLAAANLWSQLFKMDVSVVDDANAWTWRENHKNPQSGQDCYFTIGLLQEYLAWLSGGKAFSVKKAEVMDSAGMGLWLKIDKQPIE
jgi:hypothetical protein